MIKIDNKYKTVKDCANAEIIEKRSRFIAYVRPVDTEDGALEYLNYIKQKHRDARHNVYAYIIRENNTICWQKLNMFEWKVQNKMYE